MELFVEYDNLKKEYVSAAKDYDKALNKKAEYYYSVLPGAINPEVENVNVGSSNDKFLNYTIKIEEIDKEIEVRRNLRDYLAYRLKLKELELRNSKEMLDRIYVYRIIERQKVNKFCRLIGYSCAQAYRKLDEIYKKIKNETK